MHVGMMYSGVGGCNGADYVAEFLANGFRDLGVRVSMIGHHGQCDAMRESIPAGLDFIVHSSGFNLTPAAVGRLQAIAPVYMWTFTDEIGWWRDIIGPVSPLVARHYSYSRQHGFGSHVAYLPLAADPSQYHPERQTYDDAWRDVDVCMIGAQRHYRNAICAELQKRFPRSWFSWTMNLNVREIRSIYARTRVVVAPVMDCDEDVPGRAWGCPCRTFDVRACRAYQLEVSRPGLPDVYPKADTMEPIPDPMEAAAVWGDRIAARLANPKFRQEQAEADYRHTLGHHLYRHRAEHIMADHKATR